MQLRVINVLRTIIFVFLKQNCGSRICLESGRIWTVGSTHPQAIIHLFQLVFPPCDGSGNWAGIKIKKKKKTLRRLPAANYCQAFLLPLRFRQSFPPTDVILCKIRSCRLSAPSYRCSISRFRKYLYVLFFFM